MYAMELNTELINVKGVGSARFEQLKQLGLKTVADLMGYYPRKYQDYSSPIPIKDMRPGLVCLQVKISNLTTRRVRRGMHITEAIATDNTGKVKLIWFNQPYRSSSIKPNSLYYLTGEYAMSNNRLQIVSPNIELKQDSDDFKSGILPIYKESKNIKSTYIRKLIKQLEPLFIDIPETLPDFVVMGEKLMPKAIAVKALHLPQSANQLDEATARMGFEEVFILMLASASNKNQTLQNIAPKICFNEIVAKEFVSKLKFKLTDSQRRVIWQIYKDMQTTEPMNRLVEGDVGSGKTVVATMAGLMVCEQDMQVAFLAPTELLARQHYNTIKEFLGHTKYANEIALITGGHTAKLKKEIKESLAKGRIRFLIGTHAILQKDVDWHNLGLVVIDEQHRFGVEQRQNITLKAGHMPHVLCLTATPIPRSLALTVYGELSISTLDTAPSTRAGVDTELISPNSTAQMYEKIIKSLELGQQAYIVCPLVNESDFLPVASAEETYEKLRKTVFKNWKVGLLHGRMKPSDKEHVMANFRDKTIDVLVSTTVIEVGVDVPNATEMAIMDANRFGLAQLHQLRGRVGRGQHKGTCYLVMTDSSAPSRRMRAVAGTDSGFELAELDLEIRGPGAIYGHMQHGALDLNFAKITDAKLINKAKNAIEKYPQLQENMVKYKQLFRSVNKASKLIYFN